MAATLSRRALSLPARATEITTGSAGERDTFLPEVEANLATSPSVAEPRSPSTVATFSPVFDLELGGSCTSTPQDRRSRCAAPAKGGVSRRSTAAGGPIPLPMATPAGALHKLLPNPLLPQKAANAAATATPAATIGGSVGLDRSASDLQAVWGRRYGGGGAAAASGSAATGNPGAELLTPAGERLADLCKPASELELELARHLRAFRSARISKQLPQAATAMAGATAAAAVAAGNGPFVTTLLDTSGGVSLQQQQQQQPSAVCYCGGGPSGPTPGEIEALASELQSAGFMVQILDGTRLSKDARSCLRTLKHRFLVCLGRAVQPPPRGRSLSGHGRERERRPVLGTVCAEVADGGGSASRGGGGDQQQQQQSSEQPLSQMAREELLSEPLLVEVRFREQFLIANPTQAFQLLLLALPLVFVGPFRRLDAVVDIMAAEVAAVFKAAKRPLPPWRTKGAMLSKWAPGQLGELQRLMQCAAQPQPQAQLPAQAQAQPQQAQAQLLSRQGLLQGLKPQQQQQQLQQQQQQHKEQADCDKSWGSCTGDLGVPQPSTTTIAADAAVVLRTPMSECLCSPPPASTEPWSWVQRSSGDADATDAAAAVAAADAENAGATGMAPGSSGGGSGAAAAAPGFAVDGAAGRNDFTTQSEGNLEVTHLGSLEHLMSQTLTSISHIESAVAAADGVSTDGPCGSAAEAVVGPGVRRSGATGMAVLTALQIEEAADGLWSVNPGCGELSSRIRPELVPTADAGMAALAPLRPVGPQTQERQEEGVTPETTAAVVPPTLPTFRSLMGLSALSPFARMSVPVLYECEYGDQDSFGSGGGGDDDDDDSGGGRAMRPAPWSALLPRIAGGNSGNGGGGGHYFPEFTFKHTALDSHEPCHSEYSADLDLDLGHRDARGGGGGGAWRGPTLPLPTPVCAGPLETPTDTSSSAVIAAAPTEAGRSILASTPATAAAVDTDLNLEHQPLARGALGLYGGGTVGTAADGGSAATAAAVQRSAACSSRRPPPSASDTGSNGGGSGPYSLQFPRPDTLSITRRSSSDLHRAAEKFKKAKSLLATALHLAKGGGVAGNIIGSGVTGRDASAAAATAAGAAAGAGPRGITTPPPPPTQQQQQQRGDFVLRDGKAAAAAGGAAAAATVAAVAAAGPGGAGGRGGLCHPGVGGGMQVALPGGVMTQPSGDEPVWARIRTVKWNQPAAATAAAATAGHATRGAPV